VVGGPYSAAATTLIWPGILGRAGALVVGAEGALLGL
jgi:hypothetical protein